MGLLYFFKRARELYEDQGILAVETESDAEDFVARIGNGGERVRIIVGAEALYATCSKGYTQDFPIYQGEGTEEVRALGQIAKAVLIQAIRNSMAQTQKAGANEGPGGKG